MHAVAEIILPPQADIELAVKQVMNGFRRGGDDDDEESGECSWWDFWIIGGRFSGHKLEARIGKERLEAFYQKLRDSKVTVSGLQCGKQELNPADQVPMVDAMWREMFPGTVDVCPLFKHGRDQYRKDGFYADDVCKVRDIPKELACERLILAKPHYSDPSKYMADGMLCSEFWNGATWQKTDFDGNVLAGLHRLVTENGRKERTPEHDDWNVVTVDYHN